MGQRLPSAAGLGGAGEGCERRLGGSGCSSGAGLGGRGERRLGVAAAPAPQIWGGRVGAGLGWAGLGWAGWAGLGSAGLLGCWAGLCEQP